MLRIFRCPEADFAHDAESAAGVYTEDALKRLADDGFNAIWVRTIYRALLKSPRYPAFGRDSAKMLASLNTVIERGARCGVGLVVLNQEPMGLPVDDPFWDEHPDHAGATWDYNYGSEDRPVYMRSMCSTAEPVREFLVESSEKLARSLPGLAGVIAITASELMAHCYSHYPTNRPHDPGRQPLDCPRCRERSATDVVVDVLNDMRAGLSRADRDVPLIAWNWSWTLYEPDPQPGIVSRLAPGIDLMADFERGGAKVDATGRRIDIDEYALSYVGPSERFLSVAHAARERGRKVYAKLQLGTTHELASVSNLPLIANIHGKAMGVREAGLSGFMGCWNFGNELSLNTRAFSFFLSDECPEGEDAALRALAAKEFPGCRVEAVVRAWAAFGRAFDHYPFAIPFLYRSPINYALSLPLTPRPVREHPITRSWVLDARDDRDDPSPCFGPFTAEEIAERLDRMAGIWSEGLEAYRDGLADAGGARDAELAAAAAVDASLRSVRNYFRAYLLKRAWRDEFTPSFRDIARDELRVLDDALPVYESDRRQGYHSEAHGHMVTPELIEAKRGQLESLLE